MNTYENITQHTLEIPNFGLLKAGEQLRTNRVIENPNLKLIQVTQPQPPKATLEAQITPKLEASNNG